MVSKIFSKIFVSSLLVLFTLVHGSKILLVPLVGTGSHYMAMYSTAKEMASRGHNITILVSSLHHEKHSILNDHGIDFVFFKKNLTDVLHHFLFTDMRKAGKHKEWLLDIATGANYADSLLTECKLMLNDTELMARLGTLQFDLIVVDNYFHCPIVQYLSRNKSIPFVVLSPVPTIAHVSLLANRFDFNPAYMPELTSALTHDMNFSERLINIGTSMIFAAVFSLINYPYQHIRDECGIPETTAFYDDADLFLVNTHFALDYARPLLPSVVTVGGLTTRRNKTLSLVRIFVETTLTLLNLNLLKLRKISE